MNGGDSGVKKYKYLVRIIPHGKKSDAKIYEWHGVTDAFSSPTVLKARLLDDFKDILPGEFDIGYIAKKGNAKLWVCQAADLMSMYKQLETSDTITLFAEVVQASSSQGNRKHKAADATSILSHEHEVASIATQLQTKQ